MFFLGLLVLCAVAFFVGVGVPRMTVVFVVASLGVAVVVVGTVTADTENPLLVAVVDLVCVGVIAGCSAAGVVVRRATDRHAR